MQTFNYLERSSPVIPTVLLFSDRNFETISGMSSPRISITFAFGFISNVIIAHFFRPLFLGTMNIITVFQDSHVILQRA